MNAVPLPIARPTFTPTVGLSCEKWIATNHEDLTEWFLLTDGDLRNQHEFADFCETQFELARENDERFQDALWEAQLADADLEDEVWEDS